MKKELESFLNEVQQIYLEIWGYAHRKKEHLIHCEKSEGLTGIKLRIYSEETDYLVSSEIEYCVKIANSHQKTCFNTWHVQTTNTLVHTTSGNLVTAQTPMLVITFYQRTKEETEE